MDTVAYWLFKQEPSVYNYSQLEKEKKTVWDGVTNNLALKHLRSVANGDSIFFYLSGSEKSIVGIMRSVSGPRTDTSIKGKSSLVVVDVEPVIKLAKPVTLEAIKQHPLFASWELVRISRLSVMPVPQTMWDKILELGNTVIPDKRMVS